MTYQSRASFGRVPPQTVTLFQQIVGALREQVLPALPQHANPKVHGYTLELLLEIVLRDWREHDNTSGLTPEDLDDLRNFVRLAASLAGGSNINTSGLPIYQATLRGLLEDWLHNWNAPNDPGPPGPID